MIKLPHEIIEDIASKAKRLRKQKRISQEELANHSDVSFGSVKRFERTGQISLQSLLKIALVLDALEPFEKLFQMPEHLPSSLDEIIRKSK